MKTFGLVMASFFMLVVVGYSVIMFLYWKGIKDEIKERKHIIIMNEGFKGKIERMMWGKKDKNEIRLGFNASDGYYSEFAPICVNGDFIKFVAIGDSIKKNRREDFLTFSKNDGRKLTVKLDFCDY